MTGKEVHHAVCASKSSTCGCQKAPQQKQIIEFNKDDFDFESVRVMCTLSRGRSGFGFTITEDSPVRVGRVEHDSPAEEAGVRAGDSIIMVNQRNVSRSTINGVARLIRETDGVLHLEVSRPAGLPGEAQSPMTRLANPPSSSELPLPARLEPLGSAATESGFESVSELDDSGETRKRRKKKRRVGEQVQRVRQLLSHETDFIAFMRRGMKRYCPSATTTTTTTTTTSTQQGHTPLLSPARRRVLFQNVEEIHRLCRAHVTYAQGLGSANRMLSELRGHARFARFLQEPPLAAGRQPSISAFLFRPLQHVKELSLVLEDLFFITRTSSASYSALKTVTQVLRDSIDVISNTSNERVQSVTSVSSDVSSGDGSRGRGSSSSCSGSASSLSSSYSTCSYAAKAKGCRSDEDEDSWRERDEAMFGLTSSSSSSSSLSSSVPMTSTSFCCGAADRSALLRDRDRGPGRGTVADVSVFEMSRGNHQSIYQSHVYFLRHGSWLKLYQRTKGGHLTNAFPPLFLRHINRIELNAQCCTTQFAMYVIAPGAAHHPSKAQRLVFRAPTPDVMATWKNIFQHRLKGTRRGITLTDSSSSSQYSPCGVLSSSSSFAG
ncbi:uncharacterized protein LOC143289654 [Babylonia areolata]|uniref:uncharacterized protein LOC143289654 n=1 Tax=Babylonia areolata TaxID=304850 RepID=UPI003FD61D92